MARAHTIQLACLALVEAQRIAEGNFPREMPVAPLAVSSSGVGDVVRQCPCPIRAPGSEHPPRSSFGLEHPQGRENLTEMFEKAVSFDRRTQKQA